MEGFNHHRSSSSQDTVQRRRRYQVFLSLGALLFAICTHRASVFFRQRKKERITLLSKEDMEGFNHYRPSSSQDTVQHKRKYHVFLSFRGPDTRKSFVDHLFQSLSAAGFHVFLDSERLEKGENIGIGLDEAIRGSTVHIPIFSSNYASSVWCLRELSLIWTCKSVCRETTTIPLFYDVDPSVVRHQTGIYAESLKELSAKGKHSTAEMDKWKEALHNVSLLSGWSLSLTANGYEGKLVKHVVTDLHRTLKIHEKYVAKHPVGLSGPMEEVTKLLEMDNDIHQLTVGVCGMGGLGKTTLSRAVYNNIHRLFQESCFVSDIRATANESVKGLVNLQRQILRELVHVNTEFYSVADGIKQMKAHLASAKVLVILDDVDDEKQLDALVGDCYGPGSRIIITSRDEKVLQRGKIDKIYPMKGLPQDEGVQLFSWHAFLRARPENRYEDMTLQIVNACQGVPLSLEILGAHLYGERDERIWKEALKKNHKKVYESLKISYEALSHEEQQMFLDIACFFIMPLFSKYTLEFYLGFWENLGCTTAYTSLISLQGKSLIRIDDSGSDCRFWMHDHLRDLGRQIVEDESPHDPSKRSRLWCEKDIHSVLKHTEEMPKVRGLMLTGLELHQMDNLALMHNLKFLFCRGLRLKREITTLPRDLRYLVLSSCEMIGGSSGKYFSLPTTLGQLQSLYCLDICNTALGDLSSEVGHLQSLKELHITGFPLSKFPRYFENFINLKELNVWMCYELDELPALPERLVSLSVRHCKNLKKLCNMSHMTKLENLQLSCCKGVEELPPLPESLVHVKVEDCSRLQKLSSISHMIKLETLHMSSCYSLAQLPEFNWMRSLREFTASFCENLQELPPLPESLIHIKVKYCPKLQKLSSMSHMIKLETLHVSSSYSLTQLPELNWMQSLRELTLSCCVNLKELPPLPESLVHIKVEDCRRIQKLSNMSHMIKLETLHVSSCYSLVQLPELNWMQSLTELTLSLCENLEELPPFPESLIHMAVKYCPKLQKLSSVSYMIKLESLHVSSCYSLTQLPELNWMQSLRELTLSFCENLEELPPLPESLIHIKVEYCDRIQKLYSMSHMIKLKTLHVFRCASFAQLPELNWMQSVRELTLSRCVSLEELPPLPESLVRIKVEDCRRLQKLSSMSHMIKLEALHVSSCHSLVQLPELNWMHSLRELTLVYCENLKELPPLPKGLLKLTLDGCKNLKKLPLLPEGLVNLNTLGCHQLRINASQPSTRDKGKHMTSELNNETDSSLCFSVQKLFMEQGESSVPPPADPDY